MSLRHEGDVRIKNKNLRYKKQIKKKSEDLPVMLVEETEDGETQMRGTCSN